MDYIWCDLDKKVRAFHKRCYQSNGRGVAKRWSYLISLFCKSDDEGGGVKNLKKLIKSFMNGPWWESFHIPSNKMIAHRLFLEILEAQLRQVAIFLVVGEDYFL